MKQTLGFVRALRREIENSNPYAVQEQIKAANRDGVYIDRRRLARLIEGKDVRLSVSELYALEAFLAPKGASLTRTPLLEPNGIAQALSERGDLIFLMTSYPRPEQRRIELSHWDIDSMIDMQRSLDTYGAPVHTGMEHVLYHETPSTKADSREPWWAWLTEEEASVVSIGSPRACRGSEQMLSKMLGVTAYARPDPMAPPLPFTFLWASGEMNFQSRFTATPLSVAQASSALAETLRRTGAASARAIVTENEIYQEHRKGRQTVTYGVFASQRRAGRQTARTRPAWLAMCGLSGPATFGLATLLRDLPSTFPDRTVGKTPGIVWGIAEITLVPGKRPGDNREVHTVELVGSLRSTKGAGRPGRQTR